MSHNTQGAPGLVTAAATFHSVNPANQHLFSVRPGASVEDAMEAASNLLASIIKAVHLAATEYHDDILYGAVFQLEAVKAILNASELAAPAGNEEGGA